MSSNTFQGGASVSGEDGFLVLNSRGIKSNTTVGLQEQGCIGYTYIGIVPAGSGGTTIIDASYANFTIDLPTLDTGIYLMIQYTSISYNLGAGNNCFHAITLVDNMVELGTINAVSCPLNAGTSNVLLNSSYILQVTEPTVDKPFPRLQFNYYYDSTNGSNGQVNNGTGFSFTKLS